MHNSTFRVDGQTFSINHNGDYSGDVIFFIETYHPKKKTTNDYEESRVSFVDNSDQRNRMVKLIHDPVEDLASDGYEVSIPFEVIKRLVAEKLRSDMVARIEDMNEDELLSRMVKVVL